MEQCILQIWKEILNSDGHQIHQYQQNQQSLLILAELTEHKNDHCIWRWNLGTGLGMEPNVTGLNCLIGS